MDTPHTILKHRARRDSEAERFLATAYRREMDRFMGRPSYPDSPRADRRCSPSRYSASMVYARDEMIRRARTADGYLGPEPDVSDRVARLPPEVAQHLVPGGSAAAALAAHGVVDAHAALGCVFDVAKGQPSAHLVAVEIIEFGVLGAITRAKE